MPSHSQAKPYLCYIHREGRSISDLTVVVCDNDREVGPAVDRFLMGRPFVRLEVFDGDRRVLLRDGRTAA
jgi:hypothetical protein